MEERYVSVKEFAEMAGVSRQAIQARLKTSLAPFVKANEQGLKVISTKAFQLFDVQGCKAHEQGLNEKSKAHEQGLNDDSLYAALLQTIELLQGQLATKDKQIESLCNALETAQKAATQAQQLHAGTIQRELIEANTEPPTAPQPEPQKRRTLKDIIFGGSKQ